MSHATYTYDNGYGASVIDTGYGKPMFELAVTHGERNRNGAQLCYATPITDNVIGWLTGVSVREYLEQIKALPVNELCAHKRPQEDE